VSAEKFDDPDSDSGVGKFPLTDFGPFAGSTFGLSNLFALTGEILNIAYKRRVSSRNICA